MRPSPSSPPPPLPLAATLLAAFARTLAEVEIFGDGGQSLHTKIEKSKPQKWHGILNQKDLPWLA